MVREAVLPELTNPLQTLSTFKKAVLMGSASAQSLTNEMESLTVALNTAVVSFVQAPVVITVEPSFLYCASVEGELGAVVSMPKSVAAVTTSEFPPNDTHGP